MEENNNYNNYEDDYEYENGNENSLKGYKIVIVLLVIILAGVSGLYFMQTKQLKDDFAIERDTLTYQLSTIRSDFDNLKTTNDTILLQLDVERHRADSLIEQLKKERSTSRATIRKYQKEVGTLRAIMKDYVRQIDSLNTLNQKLISENVSYRKQITKQTQRAEMAEEKADEMALKIRQGSVIRARDIQLVMLNANDKAVTRASRAARLRVDMILSANDIANPGSRNVYVRITAPDGYIMATEESKTFDYQGDALIYSAAREVDYQNNDLSVGVYYNGSGITAGEYLVEVYVDGHLAGSLKSLLR